MQSETEVRERLTHFYNFYNPRQLGEIDHILDAYHGDYDALFQDLVYKYGPEPDEEGNLPKGAALRHQESLEQSPRPPSYDEYNNQQQASPSPAYTQYEIAPEDAPSRGLRSLKYDDYDKRNKRIAQVSSSYYGRGYVQEAEDSARDMLYEATLIAELNHKREGPSAADDLEWWKEQDRLTREGALQVSATGDKSFRGVSPGRGAHTPPRPTNSFIGTSKPSVGYSAHWGKAGFQSPTPKKPSKPLSDDIGNETGVQPNPSSTKVALTAQLQAAGQVPPFDVICVKCGCMAKMNADGSIVPGSHPDHSPTMSSQSRKEQPNSQTFSGEELQTPKQGLVSTQQESPESIAPPTKEAPQISGQEASRPLPVTNTSAAAPDTASARPLNPSGKRAQDSSFFGKHEESISVPDKTPTQAASSSDSPTTPIDQKSREDSVSTFNDSPQSPSRKHLSSVDTRTNRPLPPGQSPKVTPPKARPQPSGQHYHPDHTAPEGRIALPPQEERSKNSSAVAASSQKRPLSSNLMDSDDSMVPQHTNSLNSSQQSGGSDGEGAYLGKTFGEMEETQDLSHAYPELDPARVRKPEHGEVL